MDVSEEWVAETQRMFTAMHTEIDLLAQDMMKLEKRVMGGYATDPPGPVDGWVPPVLAIMAERAIVKEG